MDYNTRMITSFAFLGLLSPVGMLIALFVLAVLVFEIVMFVNVIQNPRVSRNAKIFWIVGMLLLHPFVAIAYYFISYKKVG
jgi:hypothetical protein